MIKKSFECSASALARSKRNEGAIRIGVGTDLTGAYSYAGHACANVARMVVRQINDRGGLLGRSIELFIEDTASNDTIAVGSVRKLIQRDKVDLVIGGVTSSMRNAIKDEIISRGKTLYIYPQLYEGKECTPYLFCTGPTPAQQCDELIPWLIKNCGKRFALPGSNYVWPRTLNAYARSLIQAYGGEVVLEEYYSLEKIDFSSTVSRIIASKTDVVFATTIPPGVGILHKQLYSAGFLKNGGRLSCVHFDESCLVFNQPAVIEGLVSCLDYFRGVSKLDFGSARIQADYDQIYPCGNVLFSASSAATGVYRGLKLWEVAVREAGKIDRESVAAALDHAKIEDGPGGPSEMLPGQRHCKMKMYTAVANRGKFDIVAQSSGMLDPKAC
jgi:ABC-type branched-subunit amino acid transport system substrate-binding protein